MSLALEVGLFGIAVPAAVSAGVLLLARRLERRDAVDCGAGALAVALGFAAAWVALPWAPVTPDRAWHWLPFLTLAAGAVAAFGPRLPAGRHRYPGILVTVACGFLLVPDYTEVAPYQLLWRTSVLVASYVTWRIVARWSRRGPPWPTLVLLLGWTVGCAGLMERSAIMKFAQLAGAGIAGLAPVAMLSRRPHALAGAAAPVAVLVVGLTFSARFETFAPVPTASTFLLALAPLAVLVTKPWRGVGLAAGLVAAALALATYATL